MDDPIQTPEEISLSSYNDVVDKKIEMGKINLIDVEPELTNLDIPFPERQKILIDTLHNEMEQCVDNSVHLEDYVTSLRKETLEKYLRIKIMSTVEHADFVDRYNELEETYWEYVKVTGEYRDTIKELEDAIKILKKPKGMIRRLFSL